jgi:hypothetical protein
MRGGKSCDPHPSESNKCHTPRGELIQCYATRTGDGCAPLSVHATMAECRALASEYRKFDARALSVTGLLVVVSYRCMA